MVRSIRASPSSTALAGAASRIHRLDRQQERMEKALIDVGLEPVPSCRAIRTNSRADRDSVWRLPGRSILEPQRTACSMNQPPRSTYRFRQKCSTCSNEIRRTRKLTYLFVSHDLAVIDYMCERLGRHAVGQHCGDHGIVQSCAKVGAKHPYARELIERRALNIDRVVRRVPSRAQWTCMRLMWP